MEGSLIPVYSPDHEALVRTPNLDPNTYQQYQIGAHETDPSESKQGPRTRAHRKACRTLLEPGKPQAALGVSRTGGSRGLCLFSTTSPALAFLSYF